MNVPVAMETMFGILDYQNTTAIIVGCGTIHRYIGY